MLRHFVLMSLGAACTLAAASATAQGRESRASAGNEAERLICRRIPETGSLVRTRRQCFTRAQWDRIAESAQRGAGKTITELSGGFNGNN